MSELVTRTSSRNRPGQAAPAVGSGPPTFRRARRQYVPLPDHQIELEPPPPPPVAPTLLPSPAGVLAVLGNIVAALLSWTHFNLLPVVNLFGDAAVYGYRRRRYGRAMRERDQQYRAYLHEQRLKLQALSDAERRAALTIHCDGDTCLTRATVADRHLWERAPHDPDFLHLRLGLARLPSSFRAVLRAADEPLPAADPLLAEAQQLISEFGSADHLPLALPLIDVGTCALVGPRAAIEDLCRALLVQLATYHCPTDVQIVLLLPEVQPDHEVDDQRHQWAWTRWLPHVWSEDHSTRLLATTADDAQRLVRARRSELDLRLHASGGSDEYPHRVFVVVRPDLLGGPEAAGIDALLGLLHVHGPAVKTYGIVLVDRPEQVSSACRAVIEVGSETAVLRQGGASTSDQPFIPDHVSYTLANRFARKLAPIRVPGRAPMLPSQASLLSVLGVERPEDLDVVARWQGSRPTESLAVPVGRLADGRPVLCDLHRQAHGPHGLIIGDAGLGKSELLRTIVATHAIHFDPHAIAFVLIDHKGGALADDLRGLPHRVTVLRAWDALAKARFLAALRSEQQHRRALLERIGVAHIDDYLDRFRQQQISEPMPHLMIMVDGFAGLTRWHADLVQELLGVAYLNEDLGLHLLLATSTVASVLDEEIWTHARARFCLGLTRVEESRQILGHDGAVATHVPGRAYLRIGQNPPPEPFQVAWTDALYRPASNDDRASDLLVEVTLSGTRRALHTQAPASGNQTQMQALVAHLRLVAEQLQMTPPTGPADTLSGGDPLAPELRQQARS